MRSQPFLEKAGSARVPAQVGEGLDGHLRDALGRSLSNPHGTTSGSVANAVGIAHGVGALRGNFGEHDPRVVELRPPCGNGRDGGACGSAWVACRGRVGQTSAVRRADGGSKDAAKLRGHRRHLRIVGLDDAPEQALALGERRSLALGTAAGTAIVHVVDVGARRRIVCGAALHAERIAPPDLHVDHQREARVARTAVVGRVPLRLDVQHATDVPGAHHVGQVLAAHGVKDVLVKARLFGALVVVDQVVVDAVERLRSGPAFGNVGIGHVGDNLVLHVLAQPRLARRKRHVLVKVAPRFGGGSSVGKELRAVWLCDLHLDLGGEFVGAEPEVERVHRLDVAVEHLRRVARVRASEGGHVVVLAVPRPALGSDDARSARVSCTAEVVAPLDAAARVRLDRAQRLRAVLLRRDAREAVGRVGLRVVHQVPVVDERRPLDHIVEDDRVARAARCEAVRLVIGLDDAVEARVFEHREAPPRLGDRVVLLLLLQVLLQRDGKRGNPRRSQAVGGGGRHVRAQGHVWHVARVVEQVVIGAGWRIWHLGIRSKAHDLDLEVERRRGRHAGRRFVGVVEHEHVLSEPPSVGVSAAVQHPVETVESDDTRHRARPIGGIVGRARAREGLGQKAGRVLEDEGHIAGGKTPRPAAEKLERADAVVGNGDVGALIGTVALAELGNLDVAPRGDAAAPKGREIVWHIGGLALQRALDARLRRFRRSHSR